MAGTQPYNIVLAGQFEVGKTTIFEYLHDNLLQLQGDMSLMAGAVASSSATSGTSSRKWEKWRHKITCRSGATVEVILWDTSGMEEHGIVGMTRSYFANSVAVILVYDIGETDTLHKLDDWVERAKWSDSAEVVFSLWGNDKGFGTTLVSEEDSAGFAAFHEIQKELVFKVNAESGTGVAESYQKLIEAVQSQHSPNYGHQSAIENCKWTRFLGYSTSVDSGNFTMHPASVQSSHMGHPAESLARPSTPCRMDPELHVQQVNGDGHDVALLPEHKKKQKSKSRCPC